MHGFHPFLWYCSLRTLDMLLLMQAKSFQELWLGRSTQFKTPCIHVGMDEDAHVSTVAMPLVSVPCNVLSTWRLTATSCNLISVRC